MQTNIEMAAETKKRLLVTGLGGFVGGHIQRLTGSAADPFKAYELVGVDTPYDLCEPQALNALAANARPEAVLHLAGITFVPDSVADPRRTFEVNLIGTLNLLTALSESGFRGKFLYVSSGDVYGRVDPSELPIAESRTPSPRNPYAASKAATELLCVQWANAAAFPIQIARPFNHIGPGQRESFSISGIARQLVRIKRALAPPILSTGNLDVTRDFLDVRDVLRAYASLLELEANGSIFNICSGNEYRLGDLVDIMRALLEVSVEIQVDPTKIRPGEQLRVAGDASRLRRETGWAPTVPIRESLAAVIEYWDRKESGA